MNKKLEPTELAEQVARRSNCKIKVGSIIMDRNGIFSWGWNHAGTDGLGEHAEVHALKRANRKRLAGSVVINFAIRKGREICSFPCPSCMAKLKKVGVVKVYCRNPEGVRECYNLS